MVGGEVAQVVGVLEGSLYSVEAWERAGPKNQLIRYFQVTKLSRIGLGGRTKNGDCVAVLKLLVVSFRMNRDRKVWINAIACTPVVVHANSETSARHSNVESRAVSAFQHVYGFLGKAGVKSTYGIRDAGVRALKVCALS